MTREQANVMVDALEKEANTNPAARAVFTMWSKRKRARHMASVSAIKQRLKLDGLEFPTSNYVSMLKLLASLGIGKLEINQKGRVVALREIRTTLQSIGSAAIGDGDNLNANKQRNQFTKLATTVKVPVPRSSHELDPLWNNIAPVRIAFSIKGKVVNLEIPKDLTPEEIAGLVHRFQEKGV